MKVFISWSGSQSKKLGEALRDWLPSVLQLVTPYFTPADIEKGTRWSTDIGKELEESQVGILCITSDNLHSDWILFEAGALSKRLQKSHVCPILFGITNTDLAGPLKQFQTTEFEKNDFLKLVNVINNQLGEQKLNQKTLDVVFDKWWPDLELKIKEILSEIDNPVEPIRSDREILEEILTLQRMSAGRVNRSALPVGVIKDILETHVDLHNDQTDEQSGYQDVLDILRREKKAISYLIERHIKGHTTELDDLVSQFSKLHYVTRTNSEELEEDIDSPF